MPLELKNYSGVRKIRTLVSEQLKCKMFVDCYQNNTVLFFNRFVNEIFGNFKTIIFLLQQNRHLKPKIDCKKQWKMETSSMLFSEL